MFYFWHHTKQFSIMKLLLIKWSHGIQDHVKQSQEAILRGNSQYLLPGMKYELLN
jgi:hypothetical protein